MSIVIDDLRFNYGNKRAVDGLSLNISQGFNVLLGPNGAGKSTLFSLLTGLYQASSGSITMGGFNIAQNKTKIMSSIGVVLQQSTLDLDLSVKQNLFYYAALHGISPSQALANIGDILSQLQLTDRLDDKVRTLNGGHRRRVEIARALIHQPSILLLDEATVGLDIDSRKLITHYVKSLTKTLNICVLWATHLIDEIAPDDPVIIINEGKIQAQGISGDLCKTHQVQDTYQLYRSLTANVELV